MKALSETWLSADDIMDQLREVIDPELGVNIVDLGLVYDIRIAGGTVNVDMTMTTPACPLGPYLVSQVERGVSPLAGVEAVTVNVVWDPPWDPPSMMSDAGKAQLGWR